QHPEKSREEIPRGELVLALLGFIGRAVLRCRIRLVAAAIEAQEMQDTPGRCGFRVLWPLVAHVALPCRRCRAIIEDVCPSFNRGGRVALRPRRLGSSIMGLLLML